MRTAKVQNDTQELIQACMNGNRKAQYRLYSLYVDAMLNVAMRIINSLPDAEDVVQESFVEAFRKLGSYRGDATFGAWLKRIVVNRSLNVLRTRWFRDRSDTEPETLGEEQEPDSREDSLDPRQVNAAIRELPEGYRVVLSLYLLEGYDHKEIADILEISESASKSQFSRAKKKLRTLLSEQING